MRRCSFDGDVEHRDEDVTALNGEPLVPLIRAAEEALETIDFGEALQNRALVSLPERSIEAPTLDLLSQPLALVDFAKVRNLEADSRRIELAEAGDYVCRRSVLTAKSLSGNPL
jgi:hypothetical protein